MMMAENNTVHYGGFWVRFLATIIDSIILVCIIITLLWWLYGPEALITVNQSSAMRQLLLTTGSTTIPQTTGAGIPVWINLLFNWVLPIAFTLLFWRFRSATPGKMLCGLMIVDANTLQPPTTKQYIIRFIGYFVSTVVFCLGYLWIAFDRRKQGWHDKLANTLVIYRKQEK